MYLKGRYLKNNKKIKAMSILEQFKAADKKVNDIENNDGLILSGYGGTEVSKEYEEALEEAQRLYQACIDGGINPFSE